MKPPARCKRTPPSEGTIDVSNPEELRRWAQKFRVSERELAALAPKLDYSARRVRETLGCWLMPDDPAA